jgi:hypothetical protein
MEWLRTQSDNCKGHCAGWKLSRSCPRETIPQRRAICKLNNYNDLVRSGDNQSELINDDMSVVTNAKSTLNRKLSSGDITSVHHNEKSVRPSPTLVEVIEISR